MNFDNNGESFSLALKDPKQFIVNIVGAPSFGVNSTGAFINHLSVDSNGKGIYKRGKNVVHTIRMITDVLSGKLEQDDIPAFLDEKEIVNVPGYSCHSMVVDKNGNVWIVEPGRGVIHSPADESPYCLMTNFSLLDFKASGNIAGSGTDRYIAADNLLRGTESMDVEKAFAILERVKQSESEWSTAFSMVYSQKESSVYYCRNGDFNHVERYAFM
jgi:hypothetical protein